MNRKASFGLVVFILFLILFDAVQQKYYIETFSLAPEGTELSLVFLFKQHFVRWLAWGILSIPFGIIVKRSLPKNSGQFNFETVLRIGIIMLVHTVLSLVIISIFDIYNQQLVLSLELFSEFFTFFTFQKGLTFLLASITLILILYNHSREKTIESQFVEITNLKRKSSDLEEALNLNEQSEPHLNIKTGNRFHPIPLNEIVWIQSDDYCVKIHTEDQIFTLRKSMKALEEQLAPYSFIRVHRVALLNLNFLRHINFDASTIRLTKTNAELPMSRTGAKALKKKLAESAL